MVPPPANAAESAPKLFGESQPPPACGRFDAYLYSGNRHETVPRALLLDQRLTPLERNAWQVFRLQLNDDGLTALPTYEQLRPFLSSVPCTAKASFETVARALTVLRLTRWLSLVRRRRDPQTGRMLGNLYVLHDEPLTPYEAMQLDGEYLKLVSHALSHASKGIQRVGHQVIKEISEDPMLAGRLLPTRIQVLTERLAKQGLDLPGNGRMGGAAESYPPPKTSHDSEVPSPTPLRNDCATASDSEAMLKAPPDNSLRNPKSGRTVLNSIKEVRTADAGEPRPPSRASLPARFDTLDGEQRAGVLSALRQLDVDQQHSVLAEWDARCSTTRVRNPAGYLFGIIHKALHGEFKAWACQSKARASDQAAGRPPPTPRPASTGTSNREVAQAHIDQLKTMFRMN